MRALLVLLTLVAVVGCGGALPTEPTDGGPKDMRDHCLVECTDASTYPESLCVYSSELLIGCYHDTCTDALLTVVCCTGNFCWPPVR